MPSRGAVTAAEGIHVWAAGCMGCHGLTAYSSSFRLWPVKNCMTHQLSVKQEPIVANGDGRPPQLWPWFPWFKWRAPARCHLGTHSRPYKALMDHANAYATHVTYFKHLQASSRTRLRRGPSLPFLATAGHTMLQRVSRTGAPRGHPLKADIARQKGVRLPAVLPEHLTACSTSGRGQDGATAAPACISRASGLRMAMAALVTASQAVGTRLAHAAVEQALVGPSVDELQVGDAQRACWHGGRCGQWPLLGIPLPHVPRMGDELGASPKPS